MNNAGWSTDKTSKPAYCHIVFAGHTPSFYLDNKQNASIVSVSVLCRLSVLNQHICL